MKQGTILSLVLAAGLLAACTGSSTPPTPIEPTPATTTGPEVTMPPTAAEAGGGAPTGAATFVIAPQESEVRFLIGEILAGSQKTVVGSTHAVSGELTVDLSDPQSVRLGTIQVDMSTLATDNGFRNSALHGVILETGREEYRFATFTVSSIEGVPSQVTPGQTANLQITGDLAIHGVTKQVTFTAVVTLVSETRLEGRASLTFVYQDFGVHIPHLPPQVASVEDQVTLEVDLVAERS